MEISASTRLLVLLGDPVDHALSPLMQNAAARALGLDAVYVAVRMPAAAVDVVLRGLKAIGAAGNVTVPHKEAVERSLTRKTDLCAQAGACNTFWTESGELVGDNTDVPAILGEVSALASGLGRWLLLGTGGSARAVAVASAQARAQLMVRSRDPKRAKTFAAWATTIGARARPAGRQLEADLVVNATPLGLGSHDQLPIVPDDIAGVRAALDLVYAPGGTRWVREWQARSIVAHDGRGVLLRQGVLSFERWFPGTAAPAEVMRAALGRALRA